MGINCNENDQIHVSAMYIAILTLQTDSIIEALHHSIILSFLAAILFQEIPKSDNVSSIRFLKYNVSAFQICQKSLYGL